MQADIAAQNVVVVTSVWLVAKSKDRTQVGAPTHSSKDERGERRGGGCSVSRVKSSLTKTFKCSVEGSAHSDPEAKQHRLLLLYRPADSLRIESQLDGVLQPWALQQGGQTVKHKHRAIVRSH